MCRRCGAVYPWKFKFFGRSHGRLGTICIACVGRKQSEAEAFWAKVARRGDDDCWEWMACRNPVSGYGQFGRHISGGGGGIGAHRMSWILTHGEIPGGLQVLHRCDNRPCVNPAHLFLGTQEANVHDAIRKGRMHYGERTALTKFPAKVIAELRRRVATGEERRIVAAELGISPGHANAVLNGRTRTRG